jgi:hypothetical protein
MAVAGVPVHRIVRHARVATLRKGHYILFFVGIIFPVLWIIGALIGPTAAAEARGAA